MARAVWYFAAKRWTFAVPDGSPHSVEASGDSTQAHGLGEPEFVAVTVPDCSHPRDDFDADQLQRFANHSPGQHHQRQSSVLDFSGFSVQHVALFVEP